MIGNINIISICVFIVFISYVCLTVQIHEHFAAPSVSVMGVNADFNEGLSNIKDKTKANIGQYAMYSILEMISHVVVAVCKWMSSPKLLQKPNDVSDEIWKQQVWTETLSEFGIYEEAIPDFLALNEPLLRTYKGTVDDFMKSVVSVGKDSPSQVINNITIGLTKYYVTYKKFPIDKTKYIASQDVIENWDKKFSMDMSKYIPTINSTETKTVTDASPPFVAPKFNKTPTTPVLTTSQQMTTQTTSNDIVAVTKGIPKWALIALGVLVMLIIGLSIIAFIVNKRSENTFV